MRHQNARACLLSWGRQEDIEFWQRMKKKYKGTSFISEHCEKVYISRSPSCSPRVRFLLKELRGKIEREKKRSAENGEDSNVR